MKRPTQPKRASPEKPIEASERQLLKYTRDRTVFGTLSAFWKATGASLTLILASNNVPSVLDTFDVQLVRLLLIANILLMGLFAIYCDLAQALNSVKFDLMREKLK